MSAVGRPVATDDDTVRKLEIAFRDGFSVSTACQLSGIARSTYYERCNIDEEFSDKMDVAKQWVTERAKKVVVQAIEGGDVASAKWWLERRARDEFGKDVRNSGNQLSEDYESTRQKLKALFDEPDDSFAEH